MTSTGHSPIAIKRILNDMKDLNKDPLEKEGIFHYFNEDNITTAYVMIIGPEDTPYQNGFYFFKFTFPTNYPFQPPQVKFQTLDSNVRFNPNLYTCGKVCLSLINTWEGPKWTSCQTIRSVLISLRGLVLGVSHPLQNEPGYESVKDTRSIQYNNIITHENFRVAIVKMIENTPNGFEYFKPIMIDYLKSKYTWYYDKLTELSQLDGNHVSSIYGMNIIYSYSKQLKSIQEILSKNDFEIPKIYLGKDKPTNLSDVIQVQPSNCPSKSPNDFYEGYKMISEKDGKTYEVVLLGKGKSKKKSWNLSKDVLEKSIKDIDESISSNDTDTISKKIRKAPSENAKKFPVGYTMKSPNDNNWYCVVEASRGKTLFKKWFKTIPPEDFLQGIEKEPKKIEKEPKEIKAEPKKIEKEPKEIKEEPKEIKEEPKEIKEEPKEIKEESKKIKKEPKKIEKEPKEIKEEPKEIKEEPKEIKKEPKEMKVEPKEIKKEPKEIKMEDSSLEENGSKKRKVPNEHAKDYEVGYEIKSTNDNRVYVVKLVGSGEKQFKRWVLKK